MEWNAINAFHGRKQVNKNMICLSLKKLRRKKISLWLIISLNTVSSIHDKAGFEFFCLMNSF